MQELDDNTLLREYVGRGSQEAFATLVARHVNKVYSVALRHTRNPHQAEEITQAVFVTLAQKSGQLGKKVILSGWLYQTARLMAVTFIRSEIRRARREQEAHMQSLLNENEADVWPQIAPLVDAAMAGLSETDRHAIVLRFFDGKSMKEVGAALGASEDATKMRVNRAVEKLRLFFTKRGVVIPAAALAAALSANSVQAAPVGLAKAAAIVGVTKGSTAAASTLALIKAGLQEAVKWTWLKLTTVGTIAANLIVSREIVASHFDFSGRPDAWMTRPDFWLLAVLVEIGFPLFFVAIGYGVRFLPVNQFTFKNIPNRDHWLAPERREEMFDCIFHSYLWIACFAALHMLAIQLLAVFANYQTPPHFPTWTALGIGGCFIAVVAFQFKKMNSYLKQI